MKQIKMLTKLELCNLYGFNVFRHIKDPGQKKKNKVFMCIIAFLLLVVLSYIVSLCIGLGILGAAEIIPVYLIMITSFLILFLDVFKIGGVIFSKKGYDMITSLPLTDGAIVVSRFLRMYVESLIVSGFVFIPGIISYAVFEKADITTWVAFLLTMFLVPLLPLAVAVFLGTGITAIASRMKHKALAEAGFAVVVVIGILLLSAKTGGMEEEFTPEMFTRITELVTGVIGRTYPPAVFLGNAIHSGDMSDCLLYGILSIAIVAVVMWMVAKNYHTICRNLHAVQAKHNYRISKLKSNSVKKAVLQREARRYFASGPYVSNTIIGPAMGAAASVALLFVDLEKEIAKITSQAPVELNFTAAIPLMLTAVMVMMNAVCISVSMEGKEWWIAKTLPLETKTILDAKLGFNFLLIAPFFTVAQLCLMVALKMKPFAFVLTLILSMLLIVFSCVFGLWINLLFPKLDWENETVAVKQSAASLLGGMGGVLATFVFVIPVLLIPAQFEIVVYAAEIVVLFLVTGILYRKNNEINLSGIN